MLRRLTLLIFALTLLVTGCRYRTEGGELPSIGPVREPRGDSAEFLLASTNCAEVGEVVAFTVRMKNNEVYPVTLVGTPPLDIVIQPGLWPQTEARPVRRWSESPTYPHDLNPVLKPGEIRTYTWEWTAEAIHTKHPDTLLGVHFTTAAIVGPDGGGHPPGTAYTVAIGVERMRLSNGAFIPCSQLPR